jgi:hypothetical protein
MFRVSRTPLLFLLVALLVNACQPLIRPPPDLEDSEQPFSQVGHVCGVATTIAVQGDHAFLGLSYELAVLDISDPGDPQRQSSLPISTNDLVVEGNYLYVAGRAGLTIVNIADPTAPVPTGFVPTAETATGVVVSAPYAYLVDLYSLYVVYIANPIYPTIVGSLQLTYGITDLEAVGSNVYIAARDGLHVIAVADSHRPVPVGFFKTGRATQELVITGRIVYLAAYESLYILDLDVPAAPREVARFPLKGFVGRMQWVGDLLYIANGQFGLRVFDVADPAQLVEVAADQHAGIVFDVLVQDGYVYVVNCDEGLRIFAASPAAQLAEVGVFESLGVVVDIEVAGEYVYALSGWGNTLHLIAVDDPDQAEEHVSHLFPSFVYDFAIVDAKAYLATDSGLRILDVRMPSAPIVLPNLNMPCEAVAVLGLYAFISDRAGNLAVVDLEHSDPTIVQFYPRLGNAGKLVFADDRAYLVDPEGNVLILSINDKGELGQLGGVFLPKPATRIALLDPYVLIAAGGAGILVVDVTEPAAPVIVATYDTAGYASDLAPEGRYLYVADGMEGLRVLDAGNPTQLREVGFHTLPGGAIRLAVHNGTIYVASGLGGVTILKHGLP